MNKVVSTVYCEGVVYIFTEHGDVFAMTIDPKHGPIFRKVGTLDMR